jgi:hypothetical protein
MYGRPSSIEAGLMPTLHDVVAARRQMLPANLMEWATHPQPAHRDNLHLRANLLAFSPA